MKFGVALSRNCFITLICVKMVSVFIFYGYLKIIKEKNCLESQMLSLNNFHKIDVRNIPDNYPYEHYQKLSNRTCAAYPALLELKFRNDYWQQQKTSKGVFSLFNAYVDDRTNPALLRILGTFEKRIKTNKFFCQLWYSYEKQPIITPTESVLLIYSNKWLDVGINITLQIPYLISCPIKTKVIPTSVSLVEKHCDSASNNLKVFYNKNSSYSMKNFVVCVKGLVFPFEDHSIRLIEWIELLSLLGADKIHFYKFNVHPRIETLLKYYARKGKVEVTPVKFLDTPNTPQMQFFYVKESFHRRRLQEVITYNDCFYKHMYQFKYVVLLDIDEVIMPRNGTWVDVINNFKLSFPNKTSYLFQNVYFLESFMKPREYVQDIPKYMYMLQHVYRSTKYTPHGHYVKGFHSTRHVVTLHNHFALACLENCSCHFAPTNVGHLQHYRSICHKRETEECRKYQHFRIKDTTIWNFKEQLIKRTRTVMDALGYFTWF